MKQEIPYLNVARVLACLMVVSLHSLPKISVYGIDSYFFTLVLIFTRPCVPIFLMVTGVLLFPVKNENISDFYRKRIFRIIFPLLVWGVIYSILPYQLGVEKFDQMISNIFLVVVTFPKEIGGILWYLYVLIGLYLIVPFINPKVFYDRKMLHIYLSIWLIASLINSLKIYMPEILGIGPSSAFDMLQYFSGYLGYLFLGFYINRYFLETKNLRWYKVKLYTTLAVIYFLSMIIIMQIMKYSIYNEFKELYIAITTFLSFPVILMSACFFIAIKEMKINLNGWFYKIVNHLSPLTFGIYLSHMLINRLFTDRLYTINTSPLMQASVMIITFFGAYILTLLLSKISFRKYIIG